MVHSTNVLTYGLDTNDKKRRFLRLIVFTIVKITSTDKEILCHLQSISSHGGLRLLGYRALSLRLQCYRTAGYVFLPPPPVRRLYTPQPGLRGPPHKTINDTIFPGTLMLFFLHRGCVLATLESILIQQGTSPPPAGAIIHEPSGFPPPLLVHSVLHR